MISAKNADVKSNALACLDQGTHKLVTEAVDVNPETVDLKSKACRYEVQGMTMQTITENLRTTSK